MDKFRAKIMLEQVRDQYHLAKTIAREAPIQKSQSEDINPFDKFEEDIQKGKKASIGETRMWGDKKMRKQANGKWVEVSEHGMTKKWHQAKADVYSKQYNEKTSSHHELASKLSDKEYTDEEVEGGDEDFSDYSNNELQAYYKNTGIPKAKEELHKRAQKLKELTRTDNVTDKEIEGGELEGGKGEVKPQGKLTLYSEHGRGVNQVRYWKDEKGNYFYDPHPEIDYEPGSKLIHTEKVK